MPDYSDRDQEHTDAVPFDRFDKAMWDEVREDSRALDAAVEALHQKYDYAEDFVQDVFNVLSKGDPQLRSYQEMAATHIPNRQIVEDMTRLPEMEALREWTVADGFASSAGLLSLAPALDAALKRAAALKEQAKAARQARQDARLNPDDEGAQQAAEQAEQDLQSASEEASASARSQMRKALRQAEQERAGEQEAMGAYGYGTDAGSLQRMNFADRAALAKRLSNPKLRKFAQLIGAFRAMGAAEMRRRSVDGSDEVVGVELGDDLARLTTQEMINLATPETEFDFWRRFVERGLLIKKLRGRVREGRGPIVAVVDESGSMAGAGEMWAKGLALALLDQATRQKRDFYYIGFGSAHDVLREFSFPGGRTNLSAVLDMAEGFISGGTDFAKPLARALQIVRENGQARPDVVFVSDGDAPVPSFIKDWTETRRRLSSKVFGVFVSSYGRAAPASMSAICDDVRTVGDLLDVEQVRDIMQTT